MSKVQVGQIIEVSVTQVEVWGFFCKWEGIKMTALIPYCSWIAAFCSCEQFVALNDTLKVIVARVDESSGSIRVDVRSLHLEPWEAGLLSVGSIHHAKIIRYVAKADRCNNQPAYLLEVVPGGYAMLCAQEQALTLGDTCEVVIVESRPERRHIRIERFTEKI